MTPPLLQRISNNRHQSDLLSRQVGCVDAPFDQGIAATPASNHIKHQTIHEQSGRLVDENLAMVKKSLEDFDREVKRGMYPVYELATAQNNSYVENPSFRLKFLRANMHKPKQSVHQMIRFLRLKAINFGFDKIARDITMNDMSPKEVDLLSSVPLLYHIQDDTDMNGRVILYVFSSMLNNNTCSVESLIRINYCIFFNILIPMPAVQTKGLVVVYYDIRKASDKPAASGGMNSMAAVAEFMDSLPIFFSTVHVCLNKTGQGTQDRGDSFHGLAMKTLPERAFAMTKVHYGNDVELQSILRKYGFPQDTFPVDNNGEICKRIKRLRLRKEKDNGKNPTVEAANGASRNDEETIKCCASLYEDDHDEKPSTVENVSTYDILLGRERASQNHPGNIRFRRFLEMNWDIYECAPRNKKREVAAKFARVLMAKGVRFMELSENITKKRMAINFEESVVKVGQYLREIRKKKKKKIDKS